MTNFSHLLSHIFLVSLLSVLLTSCGGSSSSPDTSNNVDPRSKINTLSSLEISDGQLTPAFAVGTSSYTVSVSNLVSEITVTPTTTDSKASVTVNGIGVASGSTSAAVALDVGDNIIRVVVTAEDGTTTKTYTITVSKTSGTYYSVGGTVSGLSGTVNLQNNGLDVFSVIANEAFTFNTTIADGSAYNVSIATQPTGQICTVNNGIGTVTGSNITNVEVTCSDLPKYTVGGTVTGLLTGTITVRFNDSYIDGDFLVIETDGAFTIPNAQYDGLSYSIRMDSRTTTEGQSCTISNNTGTLTGANVTDVQIECIGSKVYKVRGHISNASSDLTLLNNGLDVYSTERLSRTSFTFSTRLSEGDTYDVTVDVSPRAQTCTVRNGSGTVSKSNIDNVNILCENNSDRIFREHAPIISSNPITSNTIVVGDVNGDGHEDIISEGLVLLNTGNGSFTTLNPGITFEITTNSAFTRLADIDGDNDLDFIIIEKYVPTNAIHVFKNDGRGLFTESSKFGIEDVYTVDLKFADLDSDGDLDLIQINSAFTSDRIWLNDGTGQFTDTGQMLTGDWSTHAEIADLDCDNDQDLVIINANSGKPSKVWLNDGNAHFTAGEELDLFFVNDISIADVDADNDMDLVIMQRDATTIWYNDGLANFSDSGQNLGVSDFNSVADTDGDGDVDVILSNNIWLNDGNGTFTDSNLHAGTIEVPGTLGIESVLTDFDADGDLDHLVVGNTYPIELWLNKGANHFINSDQNLRTPSRKNELHLADLNADGAPDLVMPVNRENQVIFNDGKGNFGDRNYNFAPPVFYSTAAITNSVAIGDVDGDGDIDLVDGNGEGQANIVWLNDGAGVLTDSGQILGASDTSDVILGDIDNDGDLDLIEGNNQASSVWFNNGSGGFTDSGQALGSYITSEIVLADIDNDNDLDLIEAKTYVDTKLWLNDGTGVFSESGITLVPAISLATGDIDDDGDQDLILGSLDSLEIYKNDGTGTFTNTNQTTASYEAESLQLLDLDNDGDLDYIHHGIIVLNDGAGNFTYSAEQLGTYGEQVIGDIDNDGDMDYINTDNWTYPLIHVNTTNR